MCCRRSPGHHAIAALADGAVAASFRTEIRRHRPKPISGGLLVIPPSNDNAPVPTTAMTPISTQRPQPYVTQSEPLHTLVTAAARRGLNGKTRAAQIDIHLTTAGRRIRFTDFDTPLLFRGAANRPRFPLAASERQRSACVAAPARAARGPMRMLRPAPPAQDGYSEGRVPSHRGADPARRIRAARPQGPDCRTRGRSCKNRGGEQ